MATIRYTKTYFNEPGRINEDTFYSLKQQLSRNPNFEIDPNPETFSQHFSGALKVLKICGSIAAVCLLFGLGLSKHAGDFWDNLAIPAAICFLIIFFTGFQLLLEGPSYATYVKKKIDYFSRMKYAIQNTSSYREFCISFYGK